MRVTTNTKDAKAYLAAIGRVAGKNITKAAWLVAQYARGEVVRSARTEGLYWKGGLIRSWMPAVIEKHGKLFAGAQSSLSYAAIHEEGDTVRPKHRKFLAIPLSDKARNTMVWPRNWTAGKLSFIDRSKKGRPPLLVEFLSKRTILHFVLKKSVKIPGTNYIKKSLPGIEREAQSILQRALFDATQRAK